MENKYLLAKNYNIQQEYMLNAYIDAKDTVNHWCVAQVVDIMEASNQIRIHFEGWSSRYDETIKRNSQRIAPYRRHTEGYTGQKKTTLRDFKFSPVNHNIMQQKVQEIIKAEFKGVFEKPRDLTQFIRGEFYFYVDSLMSLFQNSSPEEVPAIFEFLTKDVFALIFKWLEIFPEYLSSFYESLHHPQLYLVNQDAAIAMCGPELFNILEKCFGRCLRSDRFFAKYANEYFATQGENNYASPDKIKMNGLQSCVINAFGNMRGFERVLAFINFEVKDFKDKAVKGCPFQLVMKLLRSFQSMFEMTDQEFHRNFSQNVCVALISRLDNLQESEIKELDKDILHGVIEVFKEYMMIIDSPMEVEKAAELKELQIAEKYLKCPFFEKRVRGINEFKEIYYKVYNASVKARATSDQYQSTKWLTGSKYCEWLLEHRIIEFIFIENPHVELIKRSAEIIRLLASDEQYFSTDLIDLLWVCCSEKHEDIIRSSLELMQDLAIFMPLERLGYLTAKIKSLKIEEFDEKLVNFLKNYTLNTMRNIKRLKQGDANQKTGALMNAIMKKKEVKIDEDKYYDLILFWHIFQDANKVPQKVKDLALNSLIEILQEQNEKETKDSFIFLALENIKEHQTFYSSLIFLRKILNTFPLESQVKYKAAPGALMTVQVVLGEINKKTEFQLFDIILSNLNLYMVQAAETIKRLDLTPDKAQTQVLSGYVTHEDFILAVTGFIEFVLLNSKIVLTFENVEKMFTQMVSRGVTEFESNALFELITKENEQAKAKERSFLLGDTVRKEVFQKIFCNEKYLNFERTNNQGFNCFKRLFLIVNSEERTLEGQDERLAVVNLNGLQGLDGLWSIAIMCENARVRDQCRDFLVDLYLKIKAKSPQQKKQVNELFPQRCFAHFKNANGRPDHQLNCLALIKCFITRFDGDHIVEEDMSQYPPAEIKLIQVNLLPDKANAQVRAHPTQKLWQIKRKMAIAFKLRLSEFYIKTKSGPLGEEIYDEQVREYKIDSLTIQRYQREDMEKEFPRYLIGNNKEYLSLFLELLKFGREDTKREVLNLLELLPINNDLKYYIRDTILKQMVPQAPQPATIEGGAANQPTEWQKLFMWPGVAENAGAPAGAASSAVVDQSSSKDWAYCTYYLMALEDLIIARKDQPTPEQNQAEIQQKQEFSNRFIQTGGFQFLFNLFMTQDKRALERDIIRTKLLTIIVKTVFNLFNLKQVSAFKLAVTSEHIRSLILENLAIIEHYLSSITHQLSLTKEEQSALLRQGLVRFITREYHIFNNSFQFISRMLLYNPLLIVQTLYTYPSIPLIIRQALIDIDIKSIQDSIAAVVQDISFKLENTPGLEVKPSFFFMRLFLNDCLEYCLKATAAANSKQEKARKFFEVINEVFTKTEVSKELSQIKPVPQLIKELATLILNRDIKEISARDEDVPLQGLFSLLKNILQRLPEYRESAQFSNKNEFLRYLIHDCLFHKETRGQLIQKAKAMTPKCKHNQTRERCLELLNELCIANFEGVQILIRYLKEHISETFWRTPRRSDWQITVHQQERSLTGFVGLKNIGCICYMNSIMQQLFMIPTFRKAILEVEDTAAAQVDGSVNSSEENMLHQLKMIFGGLMEMEKQYFNPKRFCSAFKDIDGQPIDPMVQKDVDEFFIMAMDRIENLVKGKKEDRVIKNLVQGVLANEFICKDCPHYSEREEPFMTISLQVKNKHSIRESLEAFVEGEMLEGDNAYYCEKCEKKVATLKRCCIKRLPNVLFMVLKRFEFNFDTMTKFKINDYCEYPKSINMQEYSQEGLAKKDLIKMMEEKNLTMEDLSEEQRAILEKDIPAKYYDYHLRGTVVHIGTAEQGHYISYIQDRENPQRDGSNKWYEFNDHLVKEFDPEELAQETFGGEDESFINNMSIQTMQGSGLNEQMLHAMKQLKAKIKNAYVLIYEREEAIDSERFNEFMDDPNVNTNRADIVARFDQCKLPKTTSAQIQIPPAIHDVILEKNKKFWLSQFIFNKTYIDSVLSIFQKITIQEENDYGGARELDLQKKSSDQFELFKFLTTFFLTTVVRSKERRIVPSYMQLIKAALRQNISLCLWLVETFSNQDLIREFLIDSPIPDMKRFIGGLLKTAMQRIYPFEHEALMRFCAQLDTPNGALDYVLQTQGTLVKGHRVVDNKIMSTKGGAVEGRLHSAPCPNLHVVTLSHHNEKLPSLVIMMNSFMHLSASTHFFLQRQLTAQFTQVFAHFAEVGEGTRLYLLKNKTVGRMLDIFYYGYPGNKEKPQITEKFRVTSLQQVPLFVVDKEFYMQSNLEKNEFKLSQLEKKLMYNEATDPFMFMIYTVSVLTRACLFSKEAAGQSTEVHQLDQDEISMLVSHESPLIWSLCEQKLVRNAVADMYAHIGFENKEFSLQFIGTCLKGLEKAYWDGMKVYERPLIRMLLVKDSCQVERIKRIFSGLLDVMKVTIGFYKEMDQLIELVYKMLQKSAPAVEYLAKNPMLIRYIEQWCKENPHIPLNQQKMKVFKQGQIAWSSLKNTQVINQQVIDKMALYTKDRMQRITMLLSREMQPEGAAAYDSDDDMYHHAFQHKERVDFIDQQLVRCTGTVDFVCEEMVYCVAEVAQQGQKPSACWIAPEADKLAPPNTLTFVNEKLRWYNFYRKLLDSLQQQ